MTGPPPPRLSAQQQKWRDAAWAVVQREQLAADLCDIISIPSPTGEEAPVAHHLAARLRAAGATGRVQHLDAAQANAWGAIGARADGRPTLMLYAPIDTLTTGSEDEDLPWAGAVMRPDMRPQAIRDGDLITGLGAGNPKGHVACVLGAVAALAASGFPGHVIAGFGAGGMPTNDRVRRHIGPRTGGTNTGCMDTGHGVGCAFLLEHGVLPDMAVIAKPGRTVSWEEVGLAWFDVIVSGTHTYVGARHRIAYRNAIADAGRLTAALDAWFPVYTRRHTDGLVAPQGTVAYIEGGTSRTAAFTPAVCRFQVDLRVSPRTTPEDATAEFSAAVSTLAAELGVEARVEPRLAIPGASTPRDHPVCAATRAALEAVEGRPHVDEGGMSGATDANILRGQGVPTARVGMPKVLIDGAEPDFTLGMNIADVAAMERLTRLLIHAAVLLCSPTGDSS